MYARGRKGRIKVTSPEDGHVIVCVCICICMHGNPWHWATQRAHPIRTESKSGRTEIERKHTREKKTSQSNNIIIANIGIVVIPPPKPNKKKKTEKNLVAFRPFALFNIVFLMLYPQKSKTNTLKYNQSQQQVHLCKYMEHFVAIIVPNTLVCDETYVHFRLN